MDNKQRATVELWLQKADHDFITAKHLLETMPFLADVICFHAQQAAEKVLKACLVFQNCHVPKTHDLTLLIDDCGKRDQSFHSLDEMLVDMSVYAVVSRYANETRQITLAEAQEAVGKAEKCMVFVKGKIKW